MDGSEIPKEAGHWEKFPSGRRCIFPPVVPLLAPGINTKAYLTVFRRSWSFQLQRSAKIQCATAPRLLLNDGNGAFQLGRQSQVILTGRSPVRCSRRVLFLPSLGGRPAYTVRPAGISGWPDTPLGHELLIQARFLGGARRDQIEVAVVGAIVAGEWPLIDDVGVYRPLNEGLEEGHVAIGVIDDVAHLPL